MIIMKLEMEVKANLWSVDETIKFWVENNDCSPFYSTVSLPDKDPNDGCTDR